MRFLLLLKIYAAGEYQTKQYFVFQIHLDWPSHRRALLDRRMWQCGSEQLGVLRELSQRVAPRLPALSVPLPLALGRRLQHGLHELVQN